MGMLSVVISMALIMYLVRKKINIGLAMLVGSVVLAATAPLPASDYIAAALRALKSPITWELTAAIVLIGMLGHILKATGAMDLMVEKLLGLLGDPRWLMLAIPGLIGLLTVPGGAMMSAPMVDNLGQRSGVAAARKTAINIIYRHIGYIAFPFIPSMVLAASLTQVTPQALAALNLPVLLVGLVVAWFVLLHPVSGRSRGQWHRRDFWLFLLSIGPVLLALGLYLLVGLAFPLALAAGILFALFNLPPGPSLGAVVQTGLDRMRRQLPAGFNPQLILVVAGIMTYKEVLHATSLVHTFAQHLVELGIPLWLLLTVLPFAIGFATGAHEASIGIALPIFAPLLPQSVYLAGVALVYAATTLGYLISPLHLCLILTREYFDAPFAGIYRYTAPIAMAMLAAALALALVGGV